MEGAPPVRSWRQPGGPAALLLAACLAGGCSQSIGTTAASFLRRANTDKDPNVRYLAYAKLGQPNVYDNEAQRDEAVKTMLAKLEPGKEPVATRAVIIHSLGVLRAAAARDAVVKAVSDPEAIIRVQACRALGKVGRAEDATVLTRVMTVDTLEDCRIAAIEALGELKPKDPRITRVLVAAMQHDDPATRLASLDALRKITGRDLGTDPAAWAKALAPDIGPIPASPPSDAGAVLATPAAEPSYPPKPAPGNLTDPEARAAVFPSASPVNPGPYPAHNPNLPARAAGR